MASGSRQDTTGSVPSSDNEASLEPGELPRSPKRKFTITKSGQYVRQPKNKKKAAVVCQLKQVDLPPYQQKFQEDSEEGNIETCMSFEPIGEFITQFGDYELQKPTLVEHMYNPTFSADLPPSNRGTLRPAKKTPFLDFYNSYRRNLFMSVHSTRRKTKKKTLQHSPVAVTGNPSGSLKTSSPLFGMDDYAQAFCKTYWKDDLVNIMVENINANINERIVKPVDLLELKALFGFIFISSIIRVCGTVRHYWDSPIRIGNAKLPNMLFTSRRFYQLMKALRFALGKTIKPDRFTDLLFQHTLGRGNRVVQYVIGQNVAVDEQIIPFVGQYVHKVSMANKPCKQGMKAYLTCESQTGFCVKWELHVPTKNNKVDAVMNRMCRELPAGTHVFTDRYYSSPKTANLLKSMHLAHTGSLQSNRIGVPDKIKELDKGKLLGKSVYANALPNVRRVVDKGIYYVSWADPRHILKKQPGMKKSLGIHTKKGRPLKILTSKKTKRKKYVHLMSTVLNPFVTYQHKCKTPNTSVNMPTAIQYYTHNMSAVDIQNGNIQKYFYKYPSRFWQVRILIWFLHMSFCNFDVAWRKRCKEGAGQLRLLTTYDMYRGIACHMVQGWLERLNNMHLMSNKT